MREQHAILMVDDDPRISHLLQRYLEAEGNRICPASSGDQMRKKLAESRVSLVLRDVRLPDGDGFTHVRELHAHPNLAVVMVTGKSDLLDKVLDLELGADDYTTKTFDERELLARVRSVLRRASEKEAEPEVAPGRTIACIAAWQLDQPGQELISSDGSRVFLTAREFQLLAALVEHGQRVLSRDAIVELLAGRDWTPIGRSIDVLTDKLRNKLGDDAQQPNLIRTVRGVGYNPGTAVELR
jgi:DNA-binding response OmpR family regulator